MIFKKAIDFCARLAIQEGGTGESYRHFLKYLMAFLQPELALEVGVYKGVGLSYMLAGYDGGEIIGIDKFIEDELVERYYGKISLIEMDSLEYLEKLDFQIKMGNQVRPALIHLDTIHEPDHVLRELNLAYRVIDIPGVICLDDVHISQEMSQWWHKVNPSFENVVKLTYPDLHTTGYGVIAIG